MVFLDPRLSRDVRSFRAMPLQHASRRYFQVLRMGEPGPVRVSQTPHRTRYSLRCRTQQTLFLPD